MIRNFASIVAMSMAVGGINSACAAEEAIDLLLPQVVVPEVDQAAKGIDQAGASPSRDNALLEEIREQIGDRYTAAATWSDSDQDRLSLLVSGTYLDDYITDGSNVAFRNDRYIADLPELPPETVQGTTKPSALSGLALSPEGIRAMSMMTPEQIKAIATMAELSQNPNADISSLLASAGSEMQPNAAPEEDAVHVGNGQNLALSGWYADELDGVVYIENDRYLGSRVGVELGAVIGQFGHVTDIDIGAAGVVIGFESGDSIRSLDMADHAFPAPLANLGGQIPALGSDPEEVTVSLAAGEIIVSDAAPAATVDALRPVPRPDRQERVSAAPAQPRIGPEG